MSDHLRGADAALERLRRLHPKLIDLSLGRIERLLHDADRCAVTRRVEADAAWVLVGDVLAARAQHHTLLDLDQGVGERPRLVIRRAQDVVGEPLR